MTSGHEKRPTRIEAGSIAEGLPPERRAFDSRGRKDRAFKGGMMTIAEARLSAIESLRVRDLPSDSVGADNCATPAPFVSRSGFRGATNRVRGLGLGFARRRLHGVAGSGF